MANELLAPGLTHGWTVYAQIRKAVNSSQIWNTVTPAFETYSTANIAHYAVTMSEEGTASCDFVGTFPSGITAGTYDVVCRRQVGGSVAESDPVVATGVIEWTGAVVAQPVFDSNGLPMTCVTAWQDVSSNNRRVVLDSGLLYPAIVSRGNDNGSTTALIQLDSNDGYPIVTTGYFQDPSTALSPVAFGGSGSWLNTNVASYADDSSLSTDGSGNPNVNVTNWGGGTVSRDVGGNPLVSVGWLYNPGTETLAQVQIDASGNFPLVTVRSFQDFFANINNVRMDTQGNPAVGVVAWVDSSLNATQVTINGASFLPDVNVGSYAGDNSVTSDGGGKPMVATAVFYSAANTTGYAVDVDSRGRPVVGVESFVESDLTAHQVQLDANAYPIAAVGTWYDSSLVTSSALVLDDAAISPVVSTGYFQAAPGTLAPVLINGSYLSTVTEGFGVAIPVTGGHLDVNVVAYKGDGNISTNGSGLVEVDVSGWDGASATKDSSGKPIVAVGRFYDGVSSVAVVLNSGLPSASAIVSAYASGQSPGTQTAASFTAVLSAVAATPASCAAAVLASAIEGSFTLQKAIMLLLAANAGKLSGATELGDAETGTITILSPDGSTTRITAVTDQFGNRLSVTYNL